MRLSDRSLSLRMTGADVALLHRELQQLGYRFPAAETSRQYFGAATRQAVLDFQRAHRLPPTGIVDERTAARINADVDRLGPGRRPGPEAPAPDLPSPPTPAPAPSPFVVQGHVRQADGTPVADVIVRAFDKGIRAEKALGEAVTDALGAYSIAYAEGGLTRTDKRGADLIVRAQTRDGRQLAASAIIFNAARDEVVDLVAGSETYRGPAEYDAHLAQLEPALQTIHLGGLTDDDLTFLAGNTGVPREHIAFLAAAARIAPAAGLAPDVFYALFRQRLSTDLPALLAQPSNVHRQALGAALDSNLISARFRQELDAIIERLRQLALDQALAPAAPAQPSSLGDLLKTTRIPEAKQRQFLDRYARHQGPVEDFWKTLGEDVDFNRNGEAASLQVALQLGLLTGQHLPLVEELQRMRQRNEFATVADLTRFDAAEWKNILARQVANRRIGAPPDIPGSNDAEREASYAAMLVRRIEDAFPAASIADAIERDTAPARQDLRRFLTRARRARVPFDLTKTNVERYLKDAPDALAGITDVARVKNELKGMQRLSKLTARYAELSALMRDGVDSAHSVVRMGRTKFVSRFSGALGGAERAAQIYRAAEHVAATALALAGEYGMASSRLSMQVISNQPLEQVEAIPDWATLFGSAELCDCGQCRSVYSPAAYFVDLLSFLKYRSAVSGDSALAILFKRRADLGDIELSCENTNTTLPYVDLANEILEDTVAPLPAFAPFDLPGTREADLDTDNVDAVRTAFTPPLSSTAAIVREELRAGAEPSWRIDDEAYSYTVRKQSNQLRVALRGRQTTGTSADRAANAQYVNRRAYDVLKARSYPWRLPFDLEWEEARAYLSHLGVRRDELMSALLPANVDETARWNNVEIAREYLGIPEAEANIINGTTTGDDGAAARGPWNLWGFNKSELDQDNAIPDPARRVSWIAAGTWVDVLADRVDILLQQSGLTYAELIELLECDFVNPPAGGTRPIQVISADPAAPATCDTARLKLAGLNEAALLTISAFVRLWRRLGWRMRDLDAATAAFGAAAIDDRLITQLSHVQRLQREFALPVSWLLGWWAALTPSTYRQLFRNVAVVNPVDASFTENPAGLAGRLSDHVSTISAAFGIAAAEVSALIASTRVAGGDDVLSLQSLSRLFRHASLAKSLKFRIDDYISLLELSGVNPFAATADTMALIEQARKVRAAGFSLAEVRYVLRHELPLGGAIVPSDATIESVLTDLRTGLRKLASDRVTADARDAFVKQTIGPAVGLDSSLLDEVAKHVASPANPARPAIAEFLEESFRAPTSGAAVTRTAFPNQFDAFTRLHKTAFLLGRLRITPAQLPWLFDYAVDAQWLDVTALPVARTASSAETFAAWVRLTDLVRLRDDLPAGESLLARMFAVARDPGGAEDALLQLLSTHMRWPVADVRALAGANGLGLSFPASYRNDRAVRRLIDAVRLVSRVGISAPQARALAGRVVAVDAARAVRHVVRAKYDETRWREIAKPLQDVLRDRQRAALVAYLVARPDRSKGHAWRNADDLYAHLLIDIEMDPCMLTSRIKQAIGSVQLFVQRCLMQLEPDVRADSAADDAWSEWKWMKTYRVWEANRRVFLYPENFLEPELRDGKSPFFEDLEAALLQNEVTDDTAETAFVRYLEQLADVAQLEICGSYHQAQDEQGAGRADVLHVFGRTHNTPHRFYYRRRIDSTYWTPWEKVDADIEGDHLIPVVWNRRLYVFWPVFTEKQEDAPVTLPRDGEEMERGAEYWDVQLAWSEYRNGKWSPKALSKEKAEIRPKVAQPNVFADTVVDGDTLTILLKYLVAVWASSTGSDRDRDLARPRRFMPLPGPRERVTTTTSREEPTITVESIVFRFVNCGDDRLDVGAGSTDGTVLLLPETRQEFGAFVHTHRRQSPTPLVLAEQEAGGLSLRYDPTLDTTIGSFTLRPERFQRFDGGQPLFYSDDARTFVIFPGDVVEDLPVGDRVRPDSLMIRRPGGGRGPQPGGRQPGRVRRRQYRFETFYHPYACAFVRDLNRSGVDGLLQRSVQTPAPAFSFQAAYAPRPTVIPPYPREDVDFSEGGAYSLYNWELFFHAPLLIAHRLFKNQRFEAAQRWFHYIFDPTDTSNEPVPQRYWRTRPLFERSNPEYQRQRIEALLQRLASGEPDVELANAIRRWQHDRFNAHLVARLRTTAYQKNVVMKYIDNLIAWGDQVFRRDTIESINEATQLYVLAANILGRRPASIPPRAVPHAQTYRTLEPMLDDFSNALVGIENLVPPMPADTPGDGSSPQPLTLPTMLYFCVPRNDRLWRYWDVVADRLFKIRHCMNIEGTVRQLALFDEAIDRDLLARAALSGVDSAADAPPHYRFSVITQKASELCADLKALGAALLAALEKRDAEALGLLRSSHEVEMLAAMRQVREQQRDEARQSLEALRKTRDLVRIRRDYYAELPFMNASEAAHLALTGEILGLAMWQEQLQWLGSAGHIVANLKLAAATSAGATFGGENIGNAAQAASAAIGARASILGTSAAMSATLGGYQRRADEWALQERLAAKEIEQVDKQILAAEIRVAIAERELQNHDRLAENAREIDDFMRGKFTSAELYGWMAGQISTLYFQSYQLVYDVAKRAERAFRYELGLAESNFVQPGYWINLKQGLLAGERLYHDLKRMEAAYLDRNAREYELTKHISLAILDPAALIQLKATGTCFVNLTELVFDMDYPGHYRRRLKSVGVTIPSVVGPYTGINCTLTLVKNTVRVSAQPGARYERDPDPDVPDDRFRKEYAAIRSIATSGGRDDAGVFELNFRDERYLPFEGAGAISQWKIDMPSEFNHFDFKTIADVVLHVRYTAHDGGDALRQAAADAVRRAMPTRGIQLLDVRQTFPTNWHQFPRPAAGADQELTLALGPEHLPLYARNRSVNVTTVHVLAQLSDAGEYETRVAPPSGPPADVLLRRTATADAPYGSLHVGDVPLPSRPSPFGTWRIKLRRRGAADYRSLTQDELTQLFIIVEFSVVV